MLCNIKKQTLLKENRFIEKFKSKSKSELEYKVEKPSLFDTEAVLAAKHILENFSDYEVNITSEKKLKEAPLIEPIFKEKSFFKNKWIYRFVIFFTAISVMISLWASNRYESSNYFAWSILNGLFFIVLISKHEKMLNSLKILSIIALLFILYNYLNVYINLQENEKITIPMKDLKFIGIYLFIIFGGELIIEKRKVQIN